MTPRWWVLVGMAGALASCDVLFPGSDPAPRDGGFDASVKILPPPATTCWSGLLPPQAEPRLPHAAVADICASARGSTGFSYPQPTTGDQDGRPFIVGRWIACSADLSFPLRPHAAVEFGANGRWRLFDADDTGALVPSAIRGSDGSYYLVGNGGLNVLDETRMSLGQRSVKFGVNLDALRFDDGAASTAIYARGLPSPQNGNDNSPSVADGSCSLVGDWDLPANPNPPGAPAATFSFDGVGNFVARPLGADVCSSPPMYGTYQLLFGAFQITTNFGFGACPWSGGASYTASFSSDCASVTTEARGDDCTGARGYFNGVTTMSRRP